MKKIINDGVIVTRNVYFWHFLWFMKHFYREEYQPAKKKWWWWSNGFERPNESFRVCLSVRCKKRRKRRRERIFLFKEIWYTLMLSVCLMNWYLSPHNIEHYLSWFSTIVHVRENISLDFDKLICGASINMKKAFQISTDTNVSVLHLILKNWLDWRQ